MTKRKVTFEQAYVDWRGHARRFNREAILACALGTLRQPVDQPQGDIFNAPWLTCLMIKWVCQDQKMDYGGGASITPQQLLDLRQMMWEIPDKTDISLRPDLPLYLFMRQILRAQVGFQRRFSRGFVREAALLAQLPGNNPLRRLFESRAGLRVETFLDLSVLTFFAVVGNITTFTSNFFEPYQPEYPKSELDAYVSLISRNQQGLVDFFRKLPDAKAKKASELHEFPALTRYPFIAVNDRLECWHRHVFVRGIEGMVHSIMSESGQDYTDRLGREFERYVLADARSTGMPVYEETNLKAWLPNQSQVPDGLLSFPGCNVFVEAKAGLFDETVMTVGSAEVYKHKTRALQKGVSQTWQASMALRSSASAPAQVRTAQVDYLLIITNKELSAGGGATLAKVYPPGTLDPPDPQMLRHLPLEHVYVVWIEDFERLMAGVRDANLDLPAFLATCVAEDKDPATASFFFEQRLDKQRVPIRLSSVVEQAFTAGEGRIRSAIERIEKTVAAAK